ncbi:hypothetical protein RND81_06G158000 [Saponaria officinalis]|uniref:Uncharacterized protein n=1 Tax=Saponaria officinalis TaxID=3572 RepID=A0AAW1KCB2_SAPOF
MATMKAEKPQRQVYCNMTNRTSTEMICKHYYNFNGFPGPQLLPPIPAGEIIYIDNVVQKGAVVYVGRNKEQCPSAWVLAWDTPASDNTAPPPSRKVYVICGPEEAIDKMTAKEIEKKLDDTGNTFSEATDPITKTTAYAGIIGAVPNDSSNVSATFGLVT